MEQRLRNSRSAWQEIVGYLWNSMVPQERTPMLTNLAQILASCFFTILIMLSRFIYRYFNMHGSQLFFMSCYLTMLAVARLYRVDNGTINEYGAVGGIGRESRSTPRTPLPIHPPQIPHDLT
jgi:hypothetical protein